MSLENRDQKQPHLTRHQKRRLHDQEQLERIGRREALKRFGLWVAGTLVTVGGGVALWQLSSRGNGSTDQPGIVPMSSETRRLYEDYQRNETKLAQVLERTDVGINWLRNNLTPRLEAYPESDIASLLAPIDIYDANKANPNRNKYLFLKRDLETRGDAALKTGIQTPLQDIRHFLFQLLGDVPLAAGFSPPDKTVSLNKQFDPNNLFDVLVLYHELEHVRQDTEVRKRLTTAQSFDSYMRFYTLGRGEKPRIIGAWEQEAYLKEIFILNALMDGRVKTDAVRNSFDVNEYLKALRAPAERRGSVELLLDIAKTIYNSGSSLTNLAPTYADTINNYYRRDRGSDIYRLNPEGKLELIP